MYVIYGLEDPRDHLYHYIGITTDVYKRFQQHVGGMSGNFEKNRWIFECREANIMIVMREIERSSTQMEAEKREKFWIQYYLQSGHPLYNLAGTQSILEEKADLERQYLKLIAAKGHLLNRIRIQQAENAALSNSVPSIPNIEASTATVLDLHKQGLSLRSIVKVTGLKYHQVRRLVSLSSNDAIETQAEVILD